MWRFCGDNQNCCKSSLVGLTKCNAWYAIKCITVFWGIVELMGLIKLNYVGNCFAL